MGAKMMTEERTVTVNAIFNIKLISIDFIQINIIISTLGTLFMASLGIVGLVTLSQHCPVLRGQPFQIAKPKYRWLAFYNLINSCWLLAAIIQYQDCQGD